MQEFKRDQIKKDRVLVLSMLLDRLCTAASFTVHKSFDSFFFFKYTNLISQDEREKKVSSNIRQLLYIVAEGWFFLSLSFFILGLVFLNCIFS